MDMRGSPILILEYVSHAFLFLLASTTLHRLKELQETYAVKVPFRADRSSRDSKLAMTLRDCIMLLRVRSYQAAIDWASY